MDLSKNNLGNEGIDALARGLKTNWSLIYLDVGSNDVTFEGAQNLFRSLIKHTTVTALPCAVEAEQTDMGNQCCPGGKTDETPSAII